MAVFCGVKGNCTFWRWSAVSEFRKAIVAVSDDYGPKDSVFTGKIEKVTIELKPEAASKRSVA